MYRFIQRLAAAMLVLSLALPAFTLTASAAPSAPHTTRIGGDDRIHTSCLIAEEGWESSDSVVLACSRSFPDALAGVPLAGALDAPILLTAGRDTEPMITEQIERLGARQIYILGGTSAVSLKLEQQLSDSGLTVIRLAGKDRYATAAAVAAKLEELKGVPRQAFFASAVNYPDALAAGPTAAALGSPILYIRPDGTLDRSTQEYLSGHGDINAVILGGSAAVGGSAEKNLSRSGASSVKRIQGSDRYRTAIAVAEAYPGLTKGGMVAATGTAFPDALAGGALAAHCGGSVVLLPAEAGRNDILRHVGRCSPGQVFVLGGQKALSDTVTDSYFGFALPQVFADEEMRAVWIPYLCQEGIDAAAVECMISDCVELGCNTVIFHARPFGDAVYRSELFPWSHVITGTQGQEPPDGFDPLSCPKTTPTTSGETTATPPTTTG